VNVLKLLSACILFCLCLGGACQSGPADVMGTVLFDGAQKVPAEGVTIVVSAFIDNTTYSFTAESDAQGEYHVKGIEPTGQYGVMAAFGTAKNTPEGFTPMWGKVNDEEVEPNGFMLQWYPVELKVGNPLTLATINFTLIDF
jgi:hypothetical protein